MKFSEREIGRPPFEEEVSAQHPLILDSDDEPKSDGEEKDEEEHDARNDTSVTEASSRRSTRERRQVYYAFPQAHLTVHHQPTTFEEATNCLEKTKWNKPMSEEMWSLKDNKV